MPIPNPPKGMNKLGWQAYVSDVIAELMRGYKETGKIGDSTPKNEAEARKQATAIAYGKLREAGYKA